MEQFTREQLVAAMKKYYSQEVNSPEDFVADKSEEAAERCVDHLLSLVE